MSSSTSSPTNSLSTLQSPSNSRCSICDDVANGCRYGVPACLGCIVFFRRSILSNKQYRCSKEGKCTIQYKSRCICRACRLQICYDVGMDPSAIQRRDVMGPRTRKSRNDVSSSESNSSAAMATIPAEPKIPAVLMIPSAHISSSTSLPASASETGVLDMVAAMQERQMTCHLSLFRVGEIDIAMDNLITLDRKMSFTGLRRTRRHDLNSMGRVGLLNATEWGQSFAEFKQLSMDMKTNVLRLFTIAFVLIEQGYLTSRQDDPDLWILQNNTYICTDYFRGMTAAEINEPENHVRAKILPELVVRVINEVGVPMKILKVDLKECAALKTIIFWSSHSDLPLETRQSFLKQRDTMFVQLMRYCSSKKYTNDSAEARFGSLMLLITNIMQCARAFLDQVRLVNFFQMMEIDSLVKDVFL